MLVWKKGRLKSIKASRIKPRSPYGNIKVVSSKSQNIKPNERKTFRKK